MNHHDEISVTVDPVRAREYFEAKRTFNTTPAGVNQAIAEKRGIVIVDVRSAEDFESGHVPGALNLPPGAWGSPAGLSKENVNVVYCYSHTCRFGGDACAVLAALGYPVIEMDGGYDYWRLSGFDVAT